MSKSKVKRNQNAGAMTLRVKPSWRKRKFKFGHIKFGHVIEISVTPFDDGRLLGYLWCGTTKDGAETATMDFTLEPRQAIAVAKAILYAALKDGRNVE